MTEFTRTPEHEEAVRRRFAVALGELSFEFQAIQQVVTHPAGYTFSYLFREEMGCWVAHHDHDPIRCWPLAWRAASARMSASRASVTS